MFPDANGEYQSPINLNSREARYDPTLLDVRLSPNYVVCRDCEVTNDGHTIQVILKSKSGILQSVFVCFCEQVDNLWFNLQGLKGSTEAISIFIVLYKMHFLGIIFWSSCEGLSGWTAISAGCSPKAVPGAASVAWTNIYRTVRKAAHTQACLFEFFCCASRSKLLISWNHLITILRFADLWNQRSEFINVFVLKINFSN